MNDGMFKNTEDMAEHLGLSTKKLKEMVDTGSIPDTAYFKHNRTYRFHVERVEAALLDGEEKGDPIHG